MDGALRALPFLLGAAGAAEEYGGVYSEAFTSNRAALSVLKSLRQWPPPVRYNAKNPAESAMDPYRDATLA